MDWAAIRAEFPALERWAYLNTATYGQMPTRSMDAEVRHWERRNEFACSDFLDWYADTERMRAAIARLEAWYAQQLELLKGADNG